MNRGHTYEVAEDAIHRIASYGIPVGGHFLVGFPGEPWQSFFDNYQLLNALPLHSIKIHQLHIFKGTALANFYQKNPQAFAFPEKAEYLRRVAEWITFLRPDLYIDRIVGDAPLKYILNPVWGVPLHRVINEFEVLLEEHDLFQGSNFPPTHQSGLPQ